MIHIKMHSMPASYSNYLVITIFQWKEKKSEKVDKVEATQTVHLRIQLHLPLGSKRP